MTPFIHEPAIYSFHIGLLRHVSNIVYIQWMEIGRSLLLDAVGMSVAQIAEQGFGPVLVETVISYKEQLRLGDRVQAEVSLSELSTASAWMEFRFRTEAGKLAATGRQRGAFIDLATGRPRRLSAEERSPFLPYLADESR